MAMRRLSSLVLRKWKEKERWAGRRRSEPYVGGEEDNEEEEEEERKMEKRDRHWQMRRRKSEPCAQTEGEEKMEEKKKSDGRKERRKSEPNVEEEVRKERKKMEAGRGRERRKSTSWLMAEERAAGQVDRKKVRRRSEPCGVLHIQLLPVSGRKRRELLQRRVGHRTSCSEEEEHHASRGRSDPTSPPDHSKQNGDRKALISF